MSATDRATMIAANATADPLDAIIAIEPPIARALSHKIALSDLPESGEGVKRCSHSGMRIVPSASFNAMLSLKLEKQ
jgi:hypothetical protein